MMVSKALAETTRIIAAPTWTIVKSIAVLVFLQSSVKPTEKVSAADIVSASNTSWADTNSHSIWPKQNHNKTMPGGLFRRASAFSVTIDSQPFCFSVESGCVISLPALTAQSVNPEVP